MKKIIKSTICSALLLSVLITASFAKEGLENFTEQKHYFERQFSDVTQNEWYCESVKTAYELSLMKGQEVGYFGVDNNVSIAEAVAMAARLNSIYYTGRDDFEQGAPWYTVYVDYAVANSIISAGGYADYEQFATRRQFAEIFAAALPDCALSAINKISGGAIADLADEQANASVYKLYRAGVLTGKGSDGSFCPDDSIQRSECAAIITRMAKENLRKTFELTPGDELLATGERINSTLDLAKQSCTLATNSVDLASSRHSTEFDTTVGALNEAQNQLTLVAKYITVSTELCKDEEKFKSVRADLALANEFCSKAAREIRYIPTIPLNFVNWYDTIGILFDLNKALSNTQETVKNVLTQ